MTRKHETIDQYIRGCSPAVVPLLQELRAYINQVLSGATESMQYGALVFFNAHKVPVIYLFGSKAYVNFGFLRSSEQEDPHNALIGSGEPSKHVKIYPDKPYDKAVLSEFISQCEGING